VAFDREEPAEGDSAISLTPELDIRRLLERASTTIPAALEAMRTADDEILALVQIRLDRPWTNAEQSCYLRASRASRAGHRHYIVACRWFDAVRRRLLEAEGTTHS